MVLCGFFVIAILGMQSVQENAKDIAETSLPGQRIEQPVYDFVHKPVTQ